jgi:hypothetical protein
LATGEVTTTGSPDVPQLPNHKVKVKKDGQRACNEKDAKGKLCAGHLKRWFFFGDEVKRKFGPDVEIYRCEHCKTLYLPSLEEEPRTGTLSW